MDEERWTALKRLPGVLVGALLLGLVLAAPALAQTYPPQKATCGVSDTSVSPGQQVTVSGDNWKPGSTVKLTLQPDGISLGQGSVGGTGSFSASVTIPSSVSAGSHSVQCSGVDAKGVAQVLGVSFSVLGAGGGVLAGTGMNLSVGLGILLGLLVVGIVTLVAGRRRARVGPGG